MRFYPRSCNHCSGRHYSYLHAAFGTETRAHQPAASSTSSYVALRATADYLAVLLATMREFRLATVTYGLASAPFLAIRTLHELAADEGKLYPLGAEVLRREAYVDDLLTGASSIAEALERRRQLERICRRGGFPLRKWAANDEAILDGVPASHRSVRTPRIWRAEEGHSTLGLEWRPNEWRPNEDGFVFILRPMGDRVITKRGILSQAAQLFDPLGWMSPVVIRAKCIIQSTWLKHIGWDDPLPAGDMEAWEALRGELPLLHDLLIPRWLGIGPECSYIEVHGFEVFSGKHAIQLSTCSLVRFLVAGNQ